MKTTCRFLKSHEGILGFAKVQVSTGETVDKPAVIASITEPKIEDGEVSQATHADWIQAAVVGALKSLQIAQERIPRTSHPTIFLEKVIGSETDTRPDVIECAAGIATWQAIATGLPDPETIFENGWTLKFEGRGI
jgi:hypothetical protein